MGPAAIPALTAALKDEDEKVRLATVRSLSEFGPAAKSAVPALVALLKDKDAWVRWEADQALEAMGPEAKAAVPLLTELLKDGDGQVRASAAHLLFVMGSEANAVVPALSALLTDKDVAVRGAAVFSLGKLGPTTVPLLTESLHDREAVVRGDAARALGRIGPQAKAVVPVLVELIKDKDRSVRKSATLALMAIRPAPVAELAGFLNSRDMFIRQAAAKSLGRMGPEAKAAIPALIAALDKDAESCDTVAEALKEIGSASVPPLIEVVKDKDATNRVAAAKVLGLFGGEAKAAVPALAEFLADEDEWPDARGAVAFTLGKVGPAAVSALTAGLKDKEADVRSGCAETLGQVGPEAKTAVPALTELLKDVYPAVREAAMKALEKIKGESRAAEGLEKPDAMKRGSSSGETPSSKP
jgi:HEAT repeat protein